MVNPWIHRADCISLEMSHKLFNSHNFVLEVSQHSGKRFESEIPEPEHDFMMWNHNDNF
jgi:hypothetical protein